MQKYCFKRIIYSFRYAKRYYILFMHTNICGEYINTEGTNTNFRMNFTYGDLGREMRQGQSEFHPCL